MIKENILSGIAKYLINKGTHKSYSFNEWNVMVSKKLKIVPKVDQENELIIDGFSFYGKTIYFNGETTYGEISKVINKINQCDGVIPCTLIYDDMFIEFMLEINIESRPVTLDSIADILEELSK